MTKKIIISVMLLFAVGINSLATASEIKTTPFAQSVATLRTEIATSKDAVKYQLTEGTSAVKASVSLKAGEQAIIYAASPKNTSPKGFWVINDAQVTSNGKNEDLTADNSIAMSNVKYRTLNSKGQLISVNGKKFENAIQLPLLSSIIIPACNTAKELSFELMLDGASNAQTTIIVQKINTAKIDALKSQFPEEVKQYVSFSKTALPFMVYRADNSLDGYLAQDAIKRVANKTSLTEAIIEANALTDTKAQSEAYLSIFAKAVKIESLEEQLSWLKVSNVEATAKRIAEIDGVDTAANKARIAELKALVAAGFEGIYDLSSCEGVANAEKALDIQKQVILSNPAFDFDKIIVGRYSMPTNSRSAKSSAMGTQTNNWSNITSAPMSGFDGEIGVISNLKGEGDYTTIYKPSWDTSMPDIQLNPEADKLLFTMVPEGDHHRQVFEYSLEQSKLEQVTDGSDEHIDYFDANFLPNGKLIVISNVGGQGVPCVNGSHQVGNICLYTPETKEMRRLTFDQDANWSPVMMHNGKVMYQRWEYTDLMHYYSRFVMNMNPDGTEQKCLFGSGMTFPNTMFDTRPLPEHPSRFVGIVSGHHGVVRSGRLFMVDPAISRNTTAAMIHEFPYKDRELEVVVKDRLVDGVYPQFIKPFPVDNETMLVSAKMSEDGLWGLYMVDTDDNLVLLKEYEGEGLMYATPFRKTKAAPIIPDKTNQASKEATVFIQDIYEGEGLPGVPRGTVKELRIHTYDYAYIKSPSNHYAMGIQSGWDIKSCLGTVPVEEDGSVIFKVPANTPISIQPLDSEGRAITWMRSWLTGMPGEVVSCVGCHEDQNQIPMPTRVIASTRAPHSLKAPEGGVRPFTFETEVQPILDRNCISCHDGNGTSKLNFVFKHVEDPALNAYAKGLSTSHLALHPYVHRQGAEAAMKVMKPYEYHANTSRLVQLLKDGHYGVELTDKEWRTLYNWIDYNVPDKGTFDPIKEYHGYDQYERRIALTKKYANGAHNPWRDQLNSYKEYLKAQGEIKPAERNFEKPKFKDVKVKGFPMKATKGETKVVEVAPGVEITFVKIPAGSFVMGENRINSNAAPEFKAKVAKSFWMSTCELSNAQVRAILPDHSSRDYDQLWKDHVAEGYPGDGDEQVAMRISYNSAMEYCKKLSAATGLKINLPTETQWEWAARGGTDSDYWYGTANADFSTKENLSDKQMLKMAVRGVNPQPMTPVTGDTWGGVHWFEYCAYIPKVESVDDGNMLPAIGGSYEANPFGLYDMLGNLAEWTRSDYYPHSEKVTKKSTSETKVVKGGSWDTHPKNARAAARRYFYPWQAPYNVGVRLVIEE